MASKPKSEKRKVAELVAKQRGIKIGSAFTYLRREAKKAGKPKTSGLTSYAAKKVRSLVRKEKLATARTWKTSKPEKQKISTGPIIRRKRFREFSGDESRVISVKGIFDFYGSDRRNRSVRFELTGDELNRFLNAADRDDAADILKNTYAGEFLAAGEKLGGNVEIDIENFTLENRTYRADVWGD